MRSALSSLDASARARLDAFWRWWSGELAALLPRPVGRVLSPSASRLVVDLEDGAAALTLCRSGTVRELGRVKLAGADPRAQLGPEARALAGRAAEVVLRLPLQDVVSTSVLLPAATEENLREVLAFEMDRYTPFRAQDVYYDYRVVARDRERHKIRVQLVAAPRERVDQPVERLRRWGLAPLAVEVRSVDGEGDAPVDLDLMPPAQRPRRNGARSRWNRALAAVALALLVAAVAIPLVRKAQTVEALESEVAEARSAAQAVQRTRTRLEQSTEEVNFLADRKQSLPAVIDLLEELTRLLPDDTWLLRFELRGETVKIQGESSTASTLIEIIERSTLFRDPSFGAPVTQNPRTGHERFVITARIARGAKQGT